MWWLYADLAAHLQYGIGRHTLIISVVPVVLRPTNRMVPGISTESLAVDVARANNINEDICQAASRFQQV